MRKTTIIVLVILIPLMAVFCNFGRKHSRLSIAKNTPESKAIHFDTLHHLVPEFYDPHISELANEHSISFMCYNSKRELIANPSCFDSVSTVEQEECWEEKSYTYKNKKRTAVYHRQSAVKCSYQRLSTDKWMKTTYPNKQKTFLTERRDTIVHDDFIGSCFTGQILFYQYYKVVKC